MKNILLALLFSSLFACAQPIIPRDVTDQITGARYTLVTARTLNAQYLASGLYSAEVGKEVQAQENKVEDALKFASGAVAVGDLSNAKNQLDAAYLLLNALNMRIAQLKAQQEVKK